MIGDWLEFAGAFALFMASHALPARPGLRRRLVAGLGERRYLALYGAVSLVLLGWLIVAAGRAPFVPLWGFAAWQTWAPNLAMPAVCLLAAFGLAAANPLSFGGRSGPHGATRHPPNTGESGYETQL